MDEAPIQFRWLAALALWTSLIGPVLTSPMVMFRSSLRSDTERQTVERPEETSKAPLMTSPPGQ